MEWRVLGAVALLVSAAVHLWLWIDGVRDQSVGPLFLVNVVAGVVIAILLLWWRHWIPPQSARTCAMPMVASWSSRWRASCSST